MKSATKKVAALALTPLLLVSLAACSGASKEEMKEGLKETIAYQDYPYNWEESINSDKVSNMADCLVEASYDDLSPSGRNTVASGVHGELEFEDSDYEVFDDAIDSCGWR